MRSCRDVSKYQSLWPNQGNNRQRVRVWQTAKAKRCCSGRRSDGVTCFCVAATTEERKGRVGREGEKHKKQKRQQMLWRFLDKATHVLCLEGIAEMTVKPQQSPALCQKLAWRKHLSVSACWEGNRRPYVRLCPPTGSHKQSRGTLILQHICYETKSTPDVYRWCITERGREVGGGSCCRCQNGKIKERRMERTHKRGQINRCPWSSGSRDVRPLHRSLTSADAHSFLRPPDASHPTAKDVMHLRTI